MTRKDMMWKDMMRKGEVPPAECGKRAGLRFSTKYIRRAEIPPVSFF